MACFHSESCYAVVVLATFDSSFWVHTVYLGLVDDLFLDFELLCTRAVEQELGFEHPTGMRLQKLLSAGNIRRRQPKRDQVGLYGDGEREAISLALEEGLVLLIDDWRPYEAAHQAGVAVINSVALLLGSYERDRRSLEQTLWLMRRIASRGTLRPEWIRNGIEVLYEIQKDE